jgi:uncharacterized protein YjiS (DUF1127 family)
MAATISHPMTICQSSAIAPRRSAERSDWFAQLGRLFGHWRARFRERQAFAEMTDRDLWDAGLARWQVEREVAKPFWRD